MQTIAGALFDNAQAKHEGWFVSEVGAEGDTWRLERDDEADILGSDRHAWRQVILEATKGSHYHIRALKFLEVHAPEEFERVENEAAFINAGQISLLFQKLVKDTDRGTFKITAWSKEMKVRGHIFTYTGTAAEGIKSAQKRAEDYNLADEFCDFQAEPAIKTEI